MLVPPVPTMLLFREVPRTMGNIEFERSGRFTRVGSALHAQLDDSTDGSGRFTRGCIALHDDSADAAIITIYNIYKVVRTPFSFTPAFSECCAARGAAHYLDLETTTIARVRLPTTMKTNYILEFFT